ncbi:MAG TPA: archease [Solirubrobacteraceae bacterium]|nr:archease [Solirubrobacteraceae bacterium]
MPYGWGEHTGELELWVTASSEREVFAEAVRAVAELLGGEGGERESRDVAVAATDRGRLLAGWLEELAFLAETEGFVPERAEELVLAPARVTARVVGHRGTPPHLIKAVTLHRLAFEPDDGGWRARVVLDV